MREQQNFMYHLATHTDMNPENFKILKRYILNNICTMTIHFTGFDLVLLEFDCDDVAFSGKMNYTVFQTALDTHKIKQYDLKEKN